MERIPLFNVFEMPRHPGLYESLRTLGPARAYAVMRELYEADRDVLMRDDLAAFAARARERLALAPALADGRLDALARQFAEYVPTLQFDCTFLTLWFEDPRLFDEIVDLRGTDLLAEALAAHRGAILLPLHLGPSYAALPVLARLVPVTTLYHRINLDELRETFFPGVDLLGIPVPAKGTLMRCVRTLRDGRALAMFPELDPAGIGPLHRPVEFMGTTVMAPAGPVHLSERTGAPLVPFTLRASGGGRYQATVLEPLFPPRGAAARDDILASLWRTIEEELLSGNPAEWEMWWEFDDMLPAAELAGAGA